MPILHGQHFQSQQQGSQNVPAPSAFSLTQQGPKVQVEVSLPQVIAQQGIAIPSPITGNALIDTGASGTCIDEQIAQQMQLPIIDQAHISTPSHDSTSVNVYPVHFNFLGSPVQIDCNRALGATLSNQGIIVLISRDVLQHCVLIYNGIAGSFTLAV
jgi:predicted aspartyl protease